jgi:Rrf2 family protein
MAVVISAPIALVTVANTYTVAATATVWQHGVMATSRNTQFAVAVHVLTYLAGEGRGRTASSDELAQSTNVNPVYVRRVLGPLREAGLVHSRPGKHGGWELAVDAREVTLAQVWRLLQGTDPLLGLHGPSPSCEVGRSVQNSLTALDHAVSRAVTDELERFTVHDVLTQSVATQAN